MTIQAIILFTGSVALLGAISYLLGYLSLRESKKKRETV